MSADTVTTFVDLALRGVRADTPVRRRTGAGPSDDGHLVVDGANAALPRQPGQPLRGARRAAVSRGEDGPGPAGRPRPAAQVLRPDHGRRRPVRADRPAARRGRAGHHRRADLHPVRRGPALPVLHDRGVAARRQRRSPPRPRPSWPRSPRPRCAWTASPQMVMTTGTTTGPDRGARHLVRCVRAVLAAVPGLPIQVQIEPPGDLARARRPARGGRHRDRHPRRVAGRRGRGGAGCRARASVPMAEYEAAWDEAVRGLRPQPGLHLPADRPRRGPGRAGRGRGAADRPRRLPVRGPVPADDRHAGRCGTGAPAPPRRWSGTLRNESARCCGTAGMPGADQRAGCAACGACSVLPRRAADRADRNGADREPADRQPTLPGTAMPVLGHGAALARSCWARSPAPGVPAGGAPAGQPPLRIDEAADRATLDAYRALRREVFVA